MRLIEKLKGDTALTHLCLGCEEEKTNRKKKRKECVTGNEIGEEGAKAMSEMLKVNKALTSLELRSK